MDENCCYWKDLGFQKSFFDRRKTLTCGKQKSFLVKNFLDQGKIYFADYFVDQGKIFFYVWKTSLSLVLWKTFSIKKNFPHQRKEIGLSLLKTNIYF